jgi:hypothetical protein
MRHWEAYLREGRAPSRHRISPFDTFRSWLTGIYESIKDYLRDENLNDAARTAFDQLLASDQEKRKSRNTTPPPGDASRTYRFTSVTY